LRTLRCTIRSRACRTDRVQRALGAPLSHAWPRGTVSRCSRSTSTHFKDINDTLGHHIGDDLMGSWHKPRPCTARNDLVARLGGDESLYHDEVADHETLEDSPSG